MRVNLRRFCGYLGLLVWSVASVVSPEAFAHTSGTPGPNWVHIRARTAEERTRLATIGVAIEVVRSDSVYGTATKSTLKKLRQQGIQIVETFSISEIAGLGFPPRDSKYHDYDELTQAIDQMVIANAGIMRKISIGKSLQGREIWGVHINTTQDGFDGVSISAKPGIVFMGNHHAREHLSAEVPLLLIRYLVDNYNVDSNITRLLDTRDVFIIPMINPDGVQYDIAGSNYKLHRKNMRDVGGGWWRNCIGVDLNRNYAWGFGGPGASSDPCSETYHGPQAFSEPETQAVKAFVEGQSNLRVLLSFHTFSELILYPWGGTNEPITDPRDRGTYEVMARTMAQWNGYTPQQSSDLYVASGDTTDWAWGWSKEASPDRPIFAFTFELSPRDGWGGAGFYPGDEIIDQVFTANLNPALYLMELADDPYRALDTLRPEADPRMSWLFQSSTRR